MTDRSGLNLLEALRTQEVALRTAEEAVAVAAQLSLTGILELRHMDYDWNGCGYLPSSAQLALDFLHQKLSCGRLWSGTEVGVL